MYAGKRIISKVLILGNPGENSFIESIYKEEFLFEVQAYHWSGLSNERSFGQWDEGTTPGQKILFTTRQLWDTAGQEKLNSLGRSFYRNSECCILVYDLTNAKSFEDIETWKTEFFKQLDPRSEQIFPMVLVGNKVDLNENRQVNEEKLKQYCIAAGGIPYFETSAKDNINVDLVFQEVAKIVLTNFQSIENSKHLPKSVRLKQMKSTDTKSGGCC